MTRKTKPTASPDCPLFKPQNASKPGAWLSRKTSPLFAWLTALVSLMCLSAGPSAPLSAFATSKPEPPAGVEDHQARIALGKGAREAVCDCKMDLWRLVTASAPAGNRAEADADADGSSGIAERVRRAGQLTAEGKPDQARDIIHTTIRECESESGDVGDCSRWMLTLRGLSTLLDKSDERTVLTNSIGMQLIRVPAHEYMMGSLKQEMDWVRLTFRKIWREGHKQWFQDELPLHPVRITRPFYMGATEVTVAQFRDFVKATGYKTDAERGDGGMIFDKKENRWVPRKGMKWDSLPWKMYDEQPVVFVSWNDAQAFCRWLSRKEKRTYRLPTEAEWESSCRGGMVWARYPWGNRLPGDKDANFGDGSPKLPESLTTVDDGFQYVSPVKSYRPNGYGLYDMGGNVMEWVEDRYDRNYYENSPIDDPKGPSVGDARVNKGGNWYASPADGRCAFRGFSGPEMSFWNLGFRVVLEDSEHDRIISASRSKKSDKVDRDKGAGADFPPTDEDGVRHFRQAMFAAQQQQWEEAIDDLEKALRVYEQRKDYKWVARVKATLAGIYAERDRRYKSKELYTQSLAQFRKIGDVNSARVILARMVELETNPGVKVVKVRKGGAADKAGIVDGDIIVEYAGETGFRVEGFKNLVNDYARMDKVTMSVYNNEQISTVVVPGGPLGVAVENIRRLPRPRGAEEERPRRRDRRQQQRQRGGDRRR